MEYTKLELLCIQEFLIYCLIKTKEYPAPPIRVASPRPRSCAES